MKSLSYDDSSLVQLMFSVQFSLKESPLADQHHNTQPGSSDVQILVPIRFPPTYLNYPGMYFEGDNAGLYFSLSDMPLKCNAVSLHLGRHTVLIFPKDHKLTHELVPVVSTE
ncbi:hypothetical protein CQW23_14183 [Capsicum baccatum]|uniref:Uncharacterized protein n=1 Tax=Capsicum baccatum TaxID=33114 RepID=A0A2G2WIF2_CAPBA|nr:hypothetical protein CQW23_14183 [Capsicum baccatum]